MIEMRSIHRSVRAYPYTSIGVLREPELLCISQKYIKHDGNINFSDVLLRKLIIVMLVLNLLQNTNFLYN